MADAICMLVAGLLGLWGLNLVSDAQPLSFHGSNVRVAVLVVDQLRSVAVLGQEVKPQASFKTVRNVASSFNHACSPSNKWTDGPGSLFLKC